MRTLIGAVVFGICTVNCAAAPSASTEVPLSWEVMPDDTVLLCSSQQRDLTGAELFSGGGSQVLVSAECEYRGGRPDTEYRHNIDIDWRITHGGGRGCPRGGGGARHASYALYTDGTINLSGCGGEVPCGTFTVVFDKSGDGEGLTIRRA